MFSRISFSLIHVYSKIVHSASIRFLHPAHSPLLILHLDSSLSEYRLSASGLQLHARIDYPGRNPRKIAVDDEHQMLLVQDGNVGRKVYASERAGDTWTPFHTLARTPHEDIDIECWTLVGPNRVALFDAKLGSMSVKIYAFT